MGEIINHESLFEATSCEDLRAGLGGEGDSADDMGMLKCVEALASVGVPNFAVLVRKSACAQARESGAYAEKSADAVAAIVASDERRACQHAPLWPINVPILKHINDCSHMVGK